MSLLRINATLGARDVLPDPTHIQTDVETNKGMTQRIDRYIQHPRCESSLQPLFIHYLFNIQSESHRKS